MHRGLARVTIVTFESLRQSTAAGNHVKAVELALSTEAAVRVCGASDDAPSRRYISAIYQWARWSKRRDITYVRNHPVAVVVVSLARLRRQTVVLEVNGPANDIVGAHPATRLLVPTISITQRWCLRLATSLVVPTPGLANYVSEIAPGKPVAVIPAGYDDRIFTPPEGAPTTDDRPYFVFVGANTSWQGVDLLLRAATTTAWPQQARLVLIGEFDNLDTSSLPPGRVAKTGVLQPSEVASIVQGAIASISPKTYQRSAIHPTGQAPLKVFEAMGCGVPCIVTDVPIQNDLIERHKCGTVVPVGDHLAIAKAASRYVQEPDRRATHAANATAAASQYGWSHIARTTREAVLGGRDR